MLAKQVMTLTGITKKALEYYENKKLLNPSRLSSGYRDYSENDIERIKEILLLRQLDFSIEEIDQILNHKKYELFDKKKKEIDHALFDLQINRVYVDQSKAWLHYKDKDIPKEEYDQDDLDTMLTYIQEDRNIPDELRQPTFLTRQKVGVFLVLCSIVAYLSVYFGIKEVDFYLIIYTIGLCLLSDKLYQTMRLVFLEFKEKWQK